MQARRSLTITLHWVVMALMLAIVAGARAPWVLWAFALAGLAMVALALVFGRMNGPGPKLEGVMRAAHPWLNRAVYAMLAAAAIVVLKALVTGTPAGRDMLIWVYALSAATALHAVFHLWRHTALCDGALRRITPRALHSIL